MENLIRLCGECGRGNVQTVAITVIDPDVLRSSLRSARPYCTPIWAAALCKWIQSSLIINPISEVWSPLLHWQLDFVCTQIQSD